MTKTDEQIDQIEAGREIFENKNSQSKLKDKEDK